jgi:flagellar motor switch protein FliG
MADEKLSGVDKAAIFLMTLGESTAAQIIQYLGPREVQKIGTAMATLQNEVGEPLPSFRSTAI